MIYGRVNACTAAADVVRAVGDAVSALGFGICAGLTFEECNLLNRARAQCLSRLKYWNNEKHECKEPSEGTGRRYLARVWVLIQGIDLWLSNDEAGTLE